MRIFVFALVFGVSLASEFTWGQPGPTIKQGDERAPIFLPAFYRANAIQIKGNAVIQLSVTSGRNEVKPDADGVTQIIPVWDKPRPLIVGKQVTAFSGSGKLLNNEALLKLLHKQTPVVCFVREKPDDPQQPEAFFTTIFREETVLLVYQDKDLYNTDE